jgi:environmental stress-induced protein Ves
MMPSLQVLRAASYRHMPWKNGGGMTAEIAVAPEGAGLDNFRWRISMAQIAQDGPFSCFPGIDRTLTVLDGKGVELEFPGSDARRRETLTPHSAPLSFLADTPVHARLLSGGVTDFNVMTRPSECRHAVRKLHVQSRLVIPTAADQLTLFCCAGRLECDFGGPHAALEPRDCVLVTVPVTQVTAHSEGADGAAAILVEIYFTTAGA